MAESIDICCPRCGHLYHADKSHLGKSIRCIQCKKIFTLIALEDPAPEEQRWPSPQVQPSSQTGNTESSPSQSEGKATPASPPLYFDRVLRSLNRAQRFLFALATFAFVMSALRPPFVLRRGVRYGWLWSHSGTRIELTRLLVEWALIVVTCGVAFVFLRDGRDLDPVLTFRHWWINRRSAVSRRAASRQSSTSPKHRARRFRRASQLALAGTVVLVAAGVGLILHPQPREDASNLSDTAAPTQSQLKQQPEDVAKEPVVNHEPAPTPTHDPVADVDTRAQPADPRPKNYNSLPTGTRIQEDVGTKGHGELTVKNGTTEDAVVRLSDAGTYETMRWFYVRAQTSAQVGRIPEGTYRLAFTTGLNWVRTPGGNVYLAPVV